MAYLIYLQGEIVIFSNTPLLWGDFPLWIAFPREEAKCILMFTIGCTTTAVHSPALENMLNAVFYLPILH